MDAIPSHKTTRVRKVIPQYPKCNELRIIDFESTVTVGKERYAHSASQH